MENFSLSVGGGEFTEMDWSANNHIPRDPWSFRYWTSSDLLIAICEITTRTDSKTTVANTVAYPSIMRSTTPIVLLFISIPHSYVRKTLQP